MKPSKPSKSRRAPRPKASAKNPVQPQPPVTLDAEESMRPIPPPERSWARELGWIASTTPLPDLADDASITRHFLACREAGVRLARSKGAWDPEGVFVDAYRSILFSPRANARGWAYLPLRVISRVWSSLRNTNARKTGTSAVALDSLPTDTRVVAVDPTHRDLSYDECLSLLRVLDDPDRDLLLQHYFLGWTLEELVGMGIRKSTPAALKAQLHRLRAKLRRIHGDGEGWL